MLPHWRGQCVLHWLHNLYIRNAYAKFIKFIFEKWPWREFFIEIPKRVRRIWAFVPECLIVQLELLSRWKPMRMQKKRRERAILVILTQQISNGNFWPKLYRAFTTNESYRIRLLLHLSIYDQIASYTISDPIRFVCHNRPILMLKAAHNIVDIEFSYAIYGFFFELILSFVLSSIFTTFYIIIKIKTWVGEISI